LQGALLNGNSLIVFSASWLSVAWRITVCSRLGRGHLFWNEEEEGYSIKGADKLEPSSTVCRKTGKDLKTGS